MGVKRANICLCIQLAPVVFVKKTKQNNYKLCEKVCYEIRLHVKSHEPESWVSFGQLQVRHEVLHVASHEPNVIVLSV